MTKVYEDGKVEDMGTSDEMYLENTRNNINQFIFNLSNQFNGTEVTFDMYTTDQAAASLQVNTTGEVGGQDGHDDEQHEGHDDEEEEEEMHSHDFYEFKDVD